MDCRSWYEKQCKEKFHYEKRKKERKKPLAKSVEIKMDVKPKEGALVQDKVAHLKIKNGLEHKLKLRNSKREIRDTSWLWEFDTKKQSSQADSTETSKVSDTNEK